MEGSGDIFPASGVTADWDGKPLSGESFRTACSQSPDYPDQDQILVQAYEHIRGAIAQPDLIHPPVALWTQSLRGFHQPRTMAVGYSLPFADGEPIRIVDDEKLVEAADYLEQAYGIYVGDRGKENTRTYNAVVNRETGEKRFIDVGRKAPRQQNTDVLW